MARTMFRLLIVLVLLVAFAAPAFAQEECPAGFAQYYVNVDTGSDEPPVGTMESPLKSVEKATELIGATGGCIISLAADGSQTLQVIAASEAAPAEAAAEAAPAEAGAEAAPAEAAAEAAPAEAAPAEAAAVAEQEVQVPDTGAALPPLVVNLLLVVAAIGMALVGWFILRRASVDAANK